MLPVWPDQENNAELQHLANHWTTTGHSKVLFHPCLGVKSDNIRTSLGIYAAGKDEQFFCWTKEKVIELRKDALAYFKTKLGIVIVNCLISLLDNVVLADVAHMNG